MHPRSLHHGIGQDKNLSTSTRGAFTTAFAKTEALPQAPAEPSPRHLPRQKPYHKHPRSLRHGIGQDKNLTTSTGGAFTTAFAKTKALPQAPADSLPRHLPRQKPYHKHPRSLHHGICQDKNLTTSTRAAFTTEIAKTTSLPQAPAEPSPRHLPRQKPDHKHARSLRHGICQDQNLTSRTGGAFTTAFAKTKPLPQAPANHHHGICQDKNFTTSTRRAFTTTFAKTKTLSPEAPAEPSPRHLPRQKPYHKHPRSLHHGICRLTTSTRRAFTTAFTQDKNLTTSTRRAFDTAFAKTKTLPQAPAEPSPRHWSRQKPYHKHPRILHHGICQDKNLTTSTREPSPRHLPRQKPYHKHPRSLHHGICQDKTLATSTGGAFTTALVKTKALPQAPAEPSPRHLPRQKPYHKHPRSLHHGISQDKNLTTSTRGAFTTAFAALPQAPAEPSPRHVPRQKPYHKHPRSLRHGIGQDKSLTTSTGGAFTTAFPKTKALPQEPADSLPRHLPGQKPYHKHPRSLHHGICQDKSLTTSTRRAFTTAFAKTKTLPQAPAQPSPRKLPRPHPYHKHPRSLHHGICQDKNLFDTAFAKTKTYHQKPPRSLHHDICQDKNLTTSTRGAFTTAFAKTKPCAKPSPRQLPRQKPYHEHPRSLHHGICQDKNLTTSTRGAFTAVFAKPKKNRTTSTRRAFDTAFVKTKKPYHKHPRSLHHGICQDKNLTTSTREPSPRHLPRQKPYHKHSRTITTAFAKTKALPQASAEPSPRHLPRQKPCHKHRRSLHHGICRLTTSTRGAFTTALVKTKALPQAPAEPSPRHLPRQKPYHKHPRSLRYGISQDKSKPYHKRPPILYQGVCQDKNLTTSTRGAFTTALVKTKALPQAPVQPSLRHLPRQKPYHKHPCSLRHGISQDKNLTKHPRSLHHDICQDKNLTTSTRGAFTTALAKTKTL